MNGFLSTLVQDILTTYIAFPFNNTSVTNLRNSEKASMRKGTIKRIFVRTFLHRLRQFGAKSDLISHNQNTRQSNIALQLPDLSLRKHAYSNILKISPPKIENFQIKNSDIFHISAQNIDCGYSVEPPQRF